MPEFILPTFKQTLMITAFVLFMMVVIEYINVQTKSLWSEKLQKSPLLQIIIAAILGIVPGCMGAFTVVSLYAHRMMGLAGLVTVMIATSGDEAFVMFALFPGRALLLHAFLFMIAVIVGMIVNYLTANIKKTVTPYGFIIHEKDYCKCFVRQKILPQLRNIVFERAALLIVTSLFIFFLVIGQIGTAIWDWKKITFLTGSAIMLFIFFTVPDHFLKEHLYHHIIRKHLLRIFLWTWGAFIALHFIQSSLILNNIIEHNLYLIMLIAILLGIIPESGPHLIFVTLFSQNLLPFSILFANSIVQDGHGMLPLLAESRKDFIKVKAINLVVGLIVGYTLLIIGL